MALQLWLHSTRDSFDFVYTVLLLHTLTKKKGKAIHSSERNVSFKL